VSAIGTRTQPRSIGLEPETAPVPRAEPHIAIQAIAIDPIAFSLDDQVTYGAVTIVVTNDVYQCESWNVALSVQAFVGEAITNLTTLTDIGPLLGAPATGYATSDLTAGTPLTDPVTVSVVTSGAAPGSYTQTIGFDLTVPGRTSTGAYASRVSVTVDRLHE
jgi:hypothetical protein